ncbi:MAG: prenyltransferase [Anaerolineaceae bacterium]|nr:prenyltransferase [Anaerolineaceae bacterium]
MGGFLLYALGAAMAVRMGIKIDWSSYLLGQVVVTSIQLMAQYLNAFYDKEVDNLSTANRTWFSGGSGILSNGIISPSVALVAARICCGLALFAGIFAALRSVWMIPIIFFSLFGSWFYSSPPFSLMSSGWGELTTTIIVALLVPLAGYCMQGSFPRGEFWWVCFPLFLVHIAMLISFEIPDQGADQLVGKKTLTVRLGKKCAAYLLDALIVFAFLVVIILMSFSNYPGRWMLWATPLAIVQLAMSHDAVHSPSRSRFFLLTTVAVVMFVLMASLSVLGIIYIA